MIPQVWSAFPTSPISQLRTSKPQKIKWLKVLPRPTSVLGAKLTVLNGIITLVFWSTSEAVSQKTWATLRSGQYYGSIMFTFGKISWRQIKEPLSGKYFISSIPPRNSHVSISRHWRARCADTKARRTQSWITNASLDCAFVKTHFFHFSLIVKI